MRVIVAMDSFKGTMSAREACEKVRDGIFGECPEAEILIQPMADGGEGTAEALMAAKNGEWIPCEVTGPLPEQRVQAGYAWFSDNETALIEMASASGITLLPRNALNPLKTTTFGTGELIRAALRKGARKIILAVGGSATVDGGVGAAQALGWSTLDRAGKPVGLGGAALQDIVTLVPPATACDAPLEVLCDVTNPLTGPNGAAYVFGPQKGATPDMILRLDRGLKQLGDVVRAQLGKEIDTLPGAGAAGGLAAGAVAFMNGVLVPGVDAVMKAGGLADRLKDADWIISGEGRFDHQSMQGKVVSGILKLAKANDVRVGVIAGSVKVDEADALRHGLAFAWRTAPEETPLDEAIRNAPHDLEQTARRFAKQYLKG